MSQDVQAILAALNEVVNRLDALEKKVDAVGARSAGLASGAEAGVIDERLHKLDRLLDTTDHVLERAPLLVGAAGDVADKLFHDGADRGVDYIERGLMGLELAEKASDPKILQALGQLLGRTELLEVAVAGANAIDSDTAKALQKLAGRKDLVALALKAAESTDAKAVAHLEKLLSRTDLLGVLVQSTESLDLLQKELAKDGQSLDQAMKRGVEITARLLKIANTPAFQQLLDSGALDPATLQVVANASTALVETRREAVTPVGPFGALSAIFDGDLQKALGFVIAIGKRFGKLVG